jgi:hypothetical protein
VESEFFAAQTRMKSGCEVFSQPSFYSFKKKKSTERAERTEKETLAWFSFACLAYAQAIFTLRALRGSIGKYFSDLYSND